MGGDAPGTGAPQGAEEASGQATPWWGVQAYRAPLCGDPLAIRRQAKAGLRAQLKATRALLPADQRRAHSRAIVARVGELAKRLAPRTVALFSPLPAEVQLLPELLRHPELAGVACWALPRMVGARAAHPGDVDSDVAVAPDLLLHRFTADSALLPGPFGVREPTATSPLVPDGEVDLVILPALAVDSRGTRLGYGGGYYDRLLPRLVHATTCVVLFDFQILVDLPAEPHDVAVHWAASERRLVQLAACSGSARA